MDKNTQQKLLDIVKRNYEEIAEDFSETRRKYLWPELFKLASAAKDSNSVLDAGCGNGRLLEALKGKKINYIGIDSSNKLIELARKKNCEFPPKADQPWAERIKNYEFLVGDILELKNFLQQNFNYIFCIAVLHHIPGSDLRVKVLKDLKERLKKDGKIILSVWNLWNQKKFRKLIFKFTILKLLRQNKMDFGDILFDWKGREGQTRYYHAFRMAELKKLIKKAGLEIESLYKDKYNYYATLKK